MKMLACQLNGHQMVTNESSPSLGQGCIQAEEAVLRSCTSRSDALQIKCKSACLLGSEPRQERNLALYWKHTILLVHISQMPVISSREYQVKD